MSVSIDQYIEQFETSIDELAKDPTKPPLRETVCHASRFVFVAARQAATLYCDVLPRCGSTDGKTRAEKLSSLFARAVELLQCKEDEYLTNVSSRWDELKPLLKTGSTSPSEAPGRAPDTTTHGADPLADTSS